MLTGGATGCARSTADDFIGDRLTLDDSDAVLLPAGADLRALERDRRDRAASRSRTSTSSRAAVDVVPAAAAACRTRACRRRRLRRLPPPVRPPSDLPPRFSGAAVFRVQADAGRSTASASATASRCSIRRSRPRTTRPPRRRAPCATWRRRFDIRPTRRCTSPWLVVIDPSRCRRRRSPASQSRRPATSPARSRATDLRLGVHKAPANGRCSPGPSDADRRGRRRDARRCSTRDGDQRDPRAAGPRAAHPSARGPSSSDPDFRFVNVRRLLLMIEKALDARPSGRCSSRNDSLTRAKLALTVDSFLRELWQPRRAGGRARPRRPSSCAATTRTTRPTRATSASCCSRSASRRRVPFEFVVLRVGRSANDLEITNRQPTRRPPEPWRHCPGFAAIRCSTTTSW